MPDSRPSLFRRYPDLAWWLFFAAVAFAFYGMRPLWYPDEGRYGETGRGMVASGDWLIPRLEGHPHLTKPPFTYWAIAVGVNLFGANEWGARFFLSLAFFGVTVCVVRLARAWGWSREQSLYSGLAYCTSALPFASGHILTTDMFLTFWETLSVLCAWQAMTLPDGDPKAPRWRAGLWIALGFAFLTKGPPGWLPMLAVAGFLIHHRGKISPRRVWSWPAFPFFLAIAFGWFLAAIADDPSRLEYFVKSELIDRVATNVHKRDAPWFIYPPIILAGVLPWVALWFPFVARVWRRFFGGAAVGWRGLKDSERFSLLWFVLPYMIFTVAKSRMVFYVAPLIVPISIWFGRLIDAWLLPRLRASAPLRRVAWGAASIWFASMLLFLNFPDRAPKARSNRAFAKELSSAIDKMGRETVDCYFLDEGVRHQIGFYARMGMTEIDPNMEELAKFDADARAAGKTNIYIVKDRGLKKPRRNFPWLRVVAQDPPPPPDGFEWLEMDNYFAAFVIGDAPPAPAAN